MCGSLYNCALLPYCYMPAHVTVDMCTLQSGFLVGSDPLPVEYVVRVVAKCLVCVCSFPWCDQWHAAHWQNDKSLHCYLEVAIVTTWLLLHLYIHVRSLHSIVVNAICSTHMRTHTHTSWTDLHRDSGGVSQPL